MTTTAPAPTVREVRRQQILDAARELVAREGLEALTFGALERRLAFTRGVITHHFANKRAIVDALLDDALARIDASTREAVAAGSHAGDQLHAVLRGMVRGFLSRPDATRVLVSFWGRITVDARAAGLNADLFRGYRTGCAELLRAGQRRGEVREDLDVDALAAVVVGLVIGIGAQAFFEDGAIDVDRAVDSAAAGVILSAC